MAINYPSAYDGTAQFGQPAGTTLVTAIDHANQHDNLSTFATIAQAVLGTTPGTNILNPGIKNASDQLLGINSGGTMNQAITKGTFNGAVLGSQSATGGTFSAITLSGQGTNSGTISSGMYGTATYQGGTVNSAVINSPTMQVWDGWIQETNTWSMAGTDTKTGTIGANYDATGKYQVGMRVKFTMGGSVQYGVITSVGAFSGGTTNFTVYSGTYAFGTTAITTPFFSPNKVPFGFNPDPINWTETFSDTSDQGQSSPTQNQWYNLGTYTLTVPIGKWKLAVQACCQGQKNAGPNSGVNMTLSTGTNTQTDTNLTTGMIVGGTPAQITSNQYMEEYVSLGTKTPYYLNAQTPFASQDNIYFRSGIAKTIIKATCDLL